AVPRAMRTRVPPDRRPRSARAGRQLPCRPPWDSRIDPAALSLALIVVVDLVQQAALRGLERTVIDARRPACVARRLDEFDAPALRVIADDEITGHKVHLLPVIVHEGRGGVGAGREAQEPRAASHLARFVEVTGENLLLDAGRIARGRHPARVHVDALE